MLDPNIAAKDRLIVALDVNTNEQALALVKKLGENVTYYKVGWQLFFAGDAYALIKQLAHMDKKVFLDLKMEDIGTTIELAMKNAPVEFVDYVELLTLKGSSAADLVKAAKRGLAETQAKNLKLLMLTALSSIDDSDIKAFYGDQMTLDKLISHNAKTALDAGCDGLIASGESVRDLRKEFRDREFYIVTPGIRPDGFSTDDHKRSLTPYDAISYGADYLVVGRPITQSDDPSKVALSVIADIERALKDVRTTSEGDSHTEARSSFQNMAQAM